MTTRTYPYKAWTLQPSFKPVEIELVDGTRDGWGDDYDRTESRRYYGASSLFSSKADAIAEGWRRVEKQEANLRKSAETLEKKRVALLKAGRE